MFDLLQLWNRKSSVQDDSRYRPCTRHGILLARLAKMRLAQAERCACERCDDLLSKVHSNCDVLAAEHSNEQWGLKFWSDQQAHMACPGFAITAQPEPCLSSTDCYEGLIDCLAAAERDWQRGLSAQCEQQDTDDYWLRKYSSVKDRCARARMVLEATEALSDLTSDEGEMF